VANFRDINYSTKPSKGVLRRIIIEIYQVIYNKLCLKDNVYVGFGSTYFVDFKLFHRLHNFHKMVSIEKSLTSKKRVEFNKPYSNIEVYFANSHEILNEILLKNKINRLIWLDYTTLINNNILKDINTIIKNSISGDFFIVTVCFDSINKPNNIDITEKKYRMQEFLKNMDEDRIPLNFSDENLNKKNLKEMTIKIIESQIEEYLYHFNNNPNIKSKLIFEQLINITYHESKSMLTFGGLLINDSQIDDFKHIDFKRIEFISKDEKSIEIKVPNLTMNEINALDKYMPNGDTSELSFDIDEKDFNNFKSIYRYYPRFTEVIT